MASSEDLIVQKFASLLASSLSIKKVGNGLEITKDGTTFIIPFSKTPTIIQSTQITKR